MLASFVDAANPWLLFLSSLVVVWLFIWGGIRLWHRQAAKSLHETFEEKFKPYFDNIDVRLSSQDEVLDEVKHEVTYNDGSSLKDGMRHIAKEVREVVGVLTTAVPTPLHPRPRPGLVDMADINAQAIVAVDKKVDGVKNLVQGLVDDGIITKTDLEKTTRDVAKATALRNAEVLRAIADQEEQEGH